VKSPLMLYLYTSRSIQPLPRNGACGGADNSVVAPSIYLSTGIKSNLSDRSIGRSPSQPSQTDGAIDLSIRTRLIEGYRYPPQSASSTMCEANRKGASPHSTTADTRAPDRSRDHADLLLSVMRRLSAHEASRRHESMGSHSGHQDLSRGIECERPFPVSWFRAIRSMSLARTIHERRG
jgi:hypothetical protein